jgi:hypothetical protein
VTAFSYQLLNLKLVIIERLFCDFLVLSGRCGKMSNLRNNLKKEESFEKFEKTEKLKKLKI